MTDEAPALAQVLLRVVDTETTGLEVAEHEIVELGWTDVLFTPANRTAVVLGTNSCLFKPTKGVPPEAMAVHHLTPAMLEPYPVFGAQHVESLQHSSNPDNGLTPMFMVAHNAAFDRQWLQTGDGIYWIDTFKVANRALPGAPSFGNQVLRYFLGLDVDPVRAEPSHRAGPDSYVTACLLVALLEKVGSLSQMEAWTRAPRFYPYCPLKKHKGQAWADVPADYLRWILRENGMEADIKAAAQDELDYRSTEYEAAQAARRAAATQENPA